jgi:hypothetical protein
VELAPWPETVQWTTPGSSSSWSEITVLQEQECVNTLRAPATQPPPPSAGRPPPSGSPTRRRLPDSSTSGNTARTRGGPMGNLGLGRIADAAACLILVRPRSAWMRTAHDGRTGSGETRETVSTEVSPDFQHVTSFSVHKTLMTSSLKLA